MKVFTLSRMLLSCGFSLLFASYIVYWPILDFPFLLDDSSNLSPLETVGSFNQVTDVFRVIFSNHSGPLGRPISMASFFISDFTWPSDPFIHRLVNVHIHTLNGFLVSLIFLRILIVYKRMDLVPIVIIFVVYWLISPSNSNVIFSVVQRMTSLSAFFGLLSLNLFLLFRDLVMRRKLVASFFVLIVQMLLFSLSVLSKESGVVIVGFMFILDKLLRLKDRGPDSTFNKLMNIGCVFYVVFIVSVNLKYGMTESYWLKRDFDFSDRLSAEVLILPQYFLNFLFMKIEGVGIMQGDQPIAYWLSTEKKIQALIFYVSLLVFVLISRKFGSLAVLWFINGHALESFGVPLELYFEHRNYLASLSVMLFVLAAMIRYPQIKVWWVVCMGLVLVLLISTLSWRSYMLMSDPLNAAKIFQSENAKSSRAKAFLIDSLIANGNVESARKILDNSDTRFRVLKGYSIFCGSSEDVFSQIMSSSIGVTETSVIHFLVKTYQNANCEIDRDELIKFIQNILDEKEIDSLMRQRIYVDLSTLYQHEGSLNKTITAIDSAILAYPETFLFETKAILLSSAGLYSQALEAVGDGLKAKSDCNYFRYFCDVKLLEMRDELEITLKGS